MGNILVAAFLVLLAFVHTCLRTLFFICVGIIFYLYISSCLLFSSRLRILAAYKHITWHCQQMIIERVYLFLGLPTTRDSFLSGFDVSFFFLLLNIILISHLSTLQYRVIRLAFWYFSS